MTKKQRKLNYWEKRSVNHEIKVFDGLNKPEKKIQRAYQRAQNYLTSEVKQIYNRYLNQSDFSEEQVKKIMNTSVGPEKIVELQSLVKTVQDKEIKKQMQDYITGLAVKSRITRLEDLKAKSYLVSKQVADVQLRASTDYYIDVINDGYNQAAAEGIIGQTDKAYSVYDDGKYPTYTIKDGKPAIEIIDWKTQKVAHTIDLERDKPIQEFKELSTKYVKNILESDWKGSNYSKRIWSDTNLLAKTLEELFTVEAMTGMSERDMTSKLMNQFNVSAYVAKRLVRTEANYMAGQAKLKGWKEHGVEKYVIVAVLDLRTSSICQGKDSKIYPASEAVVNGKDGTYPPFHPFCRTVARAYFGEQSLQGNRTAIDPVTGKRFKILQSDSYKAWEKMLIDKHGQKELDIIKEQVKNFNSDLIQYRKYQREIGKENVPKSFDLFQEMKYNNSEEYSQLKRKYRTLKEINNKSWSDTFKEKTKSAYVEFESNGHELSSHALGRFVQRTDISVNQASELLSREANYSQTDGRKVWFYDGHSFIKNADDTEYVTYVYRKNKLPKGGENPWIPKN